MYIKILEKCTPENNISVFRYQKFLFNQYVTCGFFEIVCQIRLYINFSVH